MSAGVQIRTAEARDLDALAALFGLLVEDQARWDPSFAVDPEAGDGPWRRLLQERLDHPDAGLWLASPSPGEGPGGPIGLCLASLLRRPPPFLERTRGEVEHLYVRETWRRSGAGRRLAEEALRWLAERQAARVAVQVAAGNRGGRAFWEALGFGASMDGLHRHL